MATSMIRTIIKTFPVAAGQRRAAAIVWRRGIGPCSLSAQRHHAAEGTARHDGPAHGYWLRCRLRHGSRTLLGVLLGRLPRGLRRHALLAVTRCVGQTCEAFLLKPPHPL